MGYAFENLSARFALLRFTIFSVRLTLTSDCESLVKPAWQLACRAFRVETFAESLKVFNPIPRLKMLSVLFPLQKVFSHRV